MADIGTGTCESCGERGSLDAGFCLDCRTAIGECADEGGVSFDTAAESLNARRGILAIPSGRGGPSVSLADEHDREYHGVHRSGDL